MKLTILVIALVLLSGTRSNGEVLTKDYEQTKTTQWFKSYIAGVGVGLSWANAYLAVHNRIPLYCQPDKYALDSDDYLRILDERMHDEKLRETLTVDTPVEKVLLDGLHAAFPCKK